MIVVIVAMVVAVGTYVMTFAAARGSLAPNGLVGIRTPATQRSDAAWRAGHRAALPIIAWGGVIVVIAGVVAVTGILPGEVEPEVAGLVLVACDVVVLIVAGAVAQRAALRRGRSQSSP